MIDSTVLTALICLLPLLIGTFMLLTGERLRRLAAPLTISAFGGALGLAAYIAVTQWGQPATGTNWTWFHIGATEITAGIWLDSLSRALLVLVPLVALPVAIFATNYLQKDARYATFFGLLNLFVAAMLGLVLARDLLALTLCWELVGFTSYLLIGFWFEKPDAARGARTAFLLNRLGDLGLFVAMGALLIVAGTLNISQLIAEAPSLYLTHPAVMTLAGGGLALAAIAKSAQFPLTPWLPRAMAGPTPVSALLHAATLVAAGAYLLARTYALLPPVVLTTLAVVGGSTAVWAAIAALGQTDLKKVLAYSTASQLGYVFLALGTGSPTAAVLHLIAHAFFKASLFLNAGIVTHAVEHAATGALDAQDLRQLGGLRRALPRTFATYCLAASALIGLPLTTGFLTKEAVLTSTLTWATARATAFPLAWLVPGVALLTVALTALYVTRHGRLIFFGEPRGAFDLNHVRVSARTETPVTLLAPVLGLAALAVWGWLSPTNLLHLAPTAFLQHLTATLSGMPGALPNPLLGGAAHSLSAGFTWLPVVSITLIGIGVTLGVRGVGPASGWAWARSPEAILGQFWTETIPSAALTVARAVARFDERGLDQQVIRFGKGVVIVAKLTGWLDRWIVDGVFIHGTVRGLAWLGQRLTTAPDAGVQTYYRWFVTAALAAGAWLLLV